MATQGNIRAGWLRNPTEDTLAKSFNVAEQPVILRASGLQNPAWLEHKINPMSRAAQTEVWATFTVNGMRPQLDADNSFLLISHPGIFRIVSTDATAIISYEEDGRTAEWDTPIINIGNGAGSVGPVGPVGPPGAPATFVASTAPGATAGTDIPELIYGTRDSLVGGPVAWVEIQANGATYVVPAYTKL